MNFSFLPKQRFFFRLRCYGFVFQFNFFVATISSSNSNFQLAVSADNVLSKIFAQTFLPEIIKRFELNSGTGIPFISAFAKPLPPLYHLVFEISRGYFSDNQMFRK